MIIIKNFRNNSSLFNKFQFSTATATIKPIPKGITHYEILEVSRASKVKDIKTAYYKKAKTCHPDLFPNNTVAEENFKIISLAYETLKDPTKRQIYDLGEINPNFQEGASEENYRRYYKNDLKKDYDENRYYNNKWYGFKPQKDKNNLRDEYYEVNDRWQSEETQAWKTMLIRIGAIAAIWFSIDLYRFYTKQKHKQFINTTREIVQQGKQDNTQTLQIDQEHEIALNRYIDIRAQQIEDEETGMGISESKI